MLCTRLFAYAGAVLANAALGDMNPTGVGGLIGGRDHCAAAMAPRKRAFGNQASPEPFTMGASITEDARVGQSIWRSSTSDFM